MQPMKYLCALPVIETMQKHHFWYCTCKLNQPALGVSFLVHQRLDNMLLSPVLLALRASTASSRSYKSCTQISTVVPEQATGQLSVSWVLHGLGYFYLYHT